MSGARNALTIGHADNGKEVNHGIVVSFSFIAMLRGIRESRLISICPVIFRRAYRFFREAQDFFRELSRNLFTATERNSSGSSAPLRELILGQLCKHTLSGVLSQLRNGNSLYAFFRAVFRRSICPSFSFRQLATDKILAKESGR